MSRSPGTADELERRREQAVRAVEGGESRATVATVLGVHYKTVARWVRAARTPGGLDAKPHEGAVNDLAFIADGRTLASMSQDRQFLFKADHTVGVWDLSSAGLPVLSGHTSYVYPVAYSPDGRWVASGSWDGTVRLWDAATGEACATLPQPGAVRALAFSPDGTWLITGGDFPRGELLVWDSATGRLIRQITVPDPSVQYLVLSPDGSRVAVGQSGNVKRFRVLDVASNTEVGTADGMALASSPDGKWLAGRDGDGRNLVLWDSRDLRLVATWPGHAGEINSISFRRDAARLLSA